MTTQWAERWRSRIHSAASILIREHREAAILKLIREATFERPERSSKLAQARRGLIQSLAALDEALATLDEPAEPAWDDLASFGHTREPIWVIWFEDAERSPLVITDEAEAHRQYELHSISWNCTLLETARRKRKREPRRTPTNAIYSPHANFRRDR